MSLLADGHYFCRYVYPETAFQGNIFQRFAHDSILTNIFHAFEHYKGLSRGEKYAEEQEDI